jgi:hypothetical protein
MSSKFKSYKPNQKLYHCVDYEITNQTQFERVKTELKRAFYKRLKLMAFL